jgi:hypothetical protein
MEHSLRQLWLRWHLLRVICAGEIVATSVLIMMAIPGTWWTATLPIFLLGALATILTLVRWKIVWEWITMLTQAGLFVVALLSTVAGIVSVAYVPVLLLALSMLLAGERILSTIINYSRQFSKRGNPSALEFNEPALRSSLDHLYQRLGWDGAIFGSGFLLAIAVATLGVTTPPTSYLSDPSLFAIVAALSLAMLIALKEER